VGAKKTEPGFFQWCPVPAQEAVGTNKLMRLPLNIRKLLFNCEDDGVLAEITQGRCGVSALGAIKKTVWMWSRTTCSRWPPEVSSYLNHSVALNEHIAPSLVNPKLLFLGASTRTEAVHLPHFCCGCRVTVRERWLGLCLFHTAADKLQTLYCPAYWPTLKKSRFFLGGVQLQNLSWGNKTERAKLKLGKYLPLL